LIERLMRINALRARPRRRGKPKDDGERSVIADIEPVTATGSKEPARLDRDFQADRPNQKWLAEFAARTFGSPISGRQKAGSTSLPSLTCIPGVSSGGP
jgi:transposase InsO family protein